MTTPTKNIIEILEKGQSSLADYYCQKKCNELIVYEDTKIIIYYKWDSNINLWKELTKDKIISDLSKTIEKELNISN